MTEKEASKRIAEIHTALNYVTRALIAPDADWFDVDAALEKAYEMVYQLRIKIALKVLDVMYGASDE